MSTIVQETNSLSTRELGISTNKNSVTWGGYYFDEELCMEIPRAGYFRRDNEQAVLPHAIGCQAPTHLDEYITILKGQHGL